MLSVARRMWNSAFRRSESYVRNTRRLTLEGLETRDYCAVGVTHTGGVTTIQGDDADNRINIVPYTAPDNTRMFRVETEGGSTNVPRGTQIKAFLGNGHDVLYAAGVDVAMYVLGQAGNDDITTGSARDIVGGDGGNDKIRTDGGNDLLRGGAGDDHLIGGAGSDFFNGHAGRDTIDMRDGNAALNGDRNRDPQSIDTVLRDPAQAVPGSAVIVNHTTNEVRFVGRSVDMDSGPAGDVYTLFVNGQNKGNWRAGVGKINVVAYHFTIDADVRADALRGGLIVDQLG